MLVCDVYEELNNNVNNCIKCVSCRIGKTGEITPYGSNLDWWNDIFDSIEWAEVVNNNTKKLPSPYNRLYRVSINGKIKHLLLAL